MHRKNRGDHRPWLRRVLIWTSASVGVCLGWLLLLNVALWTGFVPWVVSGDHRLSSLQMQYGSAWVLWPTRVHVRDFRLSIDAYRYQLELVVPQGEVDVALLDLLGRRFHAREIVGRDVHATFRFKAPPGKVSDKRRALFGSIEDVGEPIRQVEHPDLPPQDEAWALQLDAIDGELVELWVDELNFPRIDAYLSGGLRVRAGSMFAVDGARLEIASGELMIGDQTLAEQWSGALEVDVADYDPFSLEGPEVLGQLSVDLDADAQVVSVAALAPLLPADAPVKLHAGAGPLSLRVVLDDGVLQPATAIDYRTSALRMARPHYRGRTAATVGVVVQGDPGEARTRVALALQDLRVVDTRRDDDDMAAAITANTIEGFLATSRTDLQQSDTPIVAGRLHVPRLQVHDVAALAGISERFDPRSGGLVARLDTRMAEPGRWNHEGSGTVDNVTLAVGNTAVRTSATFSVAAHSDAKLTAGSAESIELDVSQLAIRSPKGHSTGAWLEVTDGTAEWQDKTIDAHLVGKLDDLRPILTHLDERERLAERVPDLELTEAFDFELDIQRQANVMDLRVVSLDRPGLRIEGFRRSRGDAVRSGFRLTRANIGFTREEPAHNSEIVAGADEDWMTRTIGWAKAL